MPFLFLRTLNDSSDERDAGANYPSLVEARKATVIAAGAFASREVCQPNSIIAAQLEAADGTPLYRVSLSMSAPDRGVR